MLFTDPLVLIDSMGALAPAELDGLIEALARPELRPTPAHDLARVSALAARFGHDHDPATLDEALRTYATCTYRGLARGRVGRSLILLRLKAGMAGQPFDAGQIHAMIDDAGEDPAMPGSAAALRVLTDALSALGDDPRYDRDDALRRLDAMASEVPPDSPLAGLVPLMRTALAVKRGGEGGVYSDASAAAEHARSLLSLPDLGSSERLHAEAMLAAAEGMRAAQHGEAGEAASAILRLSELTDRLPADDPAAAPYRSLLRDATGATTAGDAAEPGLSAGERTWRRWMAATAVLQPAMDRQDAAELARGVRMLREAADTAPPGYPHTATIDTMLGGLLCARFQLGAGRPRPGRGAATAGERPRAGRAPGASRLDVERDAARLGLPARRPHVPGPGGRPRGAARSRLVGPAAGRHRPATPSRWPAGAWPTATSPARPRPWTPVDA